MPKDDHFLAYSQDDTPCVGIQWLMSQEGLFFVLLRCRQFENLMRLAKLVLDTSSFPFPFPC